MNAVTSPRVTICLPTIGRLTYIKETLDSLKSQSLTDYELLILYNGGDTGVAGTLASLAGEHPGGRVLPEAAAIPMFANFNRGLREARGDYVAFFHDDDIYHADFLKRSVEALDANGTTAFAGSNYLVIDASSKVTGTRRLIKRTGVQPGHDFIRDLISRGRGVFPTPGIVFRRSAFDDRGWDENLSMHFGDFVVLMEMAETQDAMLIADPLVSIRLHGKNASNVEMSRSAPMLYRALIKYIEDFQLRWPLLEDFARTLRAPARSTLRRFLVWGWLSAADDEEARRCTQLLHENGNTVLAGTLDLFASFGVGAHRRKGLAGAVRRLGRVTG